MTDNVDEQITLPDRLIGSVDLARVRRELDELDDSINQSNLRSPGEPTKLARSSVTLEEIARANKIQLTDEKQRMELKNLLLMLSEHAPRIHMGLASEPSAGFTRKIIGWLRSNIHPFTLLEVGLQPSIAAGCTLRTNNKFFDMSLRSHFSENRDLLLQKITEVGTKAEDDALRAEIEAENAARRAENSAQ